MAALDLDALHPGARAALEEQWVGVGAGGLPCGAAVTQLDVVLARGRNRVYEAATGDDPLEDTRLAHAECNAIARVPASLDHGRLVLWSTQHPCAMCDAVAAFAGVGEVVVIADDLSIPTVTETPGVRYRRLGDATWWMVANLLFVVGPLAAGRGVETLDRAREASPGLAALAESLVASGELARASAAREPLETALAPHAATLVSLGATWSAGRR